MAVCWGIEYTLKNRFLIFLEKPTSQDHLVPNPPSSKMRMFASWSFLGISGQLWRGSERILSTNALKAPALKAMPRLHPRLLQTRRLWKRPQKKSPFEQQPLKRNVKSYTLLKYWWVTLLSTSIPLWSRDGIAADFGHCPTRHGACARIAPWKRRRSDVRPITHCDCSSQ